MVDKGQIYTKRPLQNALKQLNRRVWSLRKDFLGRVEELIAKRRYGRTEGKRKRGKRTGRRERISAERFFLREALEKKVV